MGCTSMKDGLHKGKCNRKKITWNQEKTAEIPWRPNEDESLEN